MAEGGAAAAPASTNEAEQVANIKARSASLLACDAELNVELCELRAVVATATSKREVVRAYAFTLRKRWGRRAHNRNHTRLPM